MPDSALVTRESQRLALIRRAAGVESYIGQGAPGFHFGRYICLSCSDSRHDPPYRPFRLDTHIQQHLASNPDHRIRFYCWDDGELEDEWRLDGSSGGGEFLPPAANFNLVLPADPVPVHPFMVLAALSVLSQAGLNPSITSSPVAQRLPEPEVVLLPHNEAESLRAIRAAPGVTTLIVAGELGLLRQTVAAIVRRLSMGGHVRRGEYENAEKLYPVGDRPIGKVRPREKARVVRRRREGGLQND